MSVCFIKVFLFLKISQNGKTLFTRYFPEILLALLKKFLKLFILACLLCFALLFFKSFQNFLYLLALKVYRTFQKSLTFFLYLALKVSKTFYKILALKVYKTFLKHGSMGSTACFEIKTGPWAQPFALKQIREPGLNRAPVVDFFKTV